MSSIILHNNTSRYVHPAVRMIYEPSESEEEEVHEDGEVPSLRRSSTTASRNAKPPTTSSAPPPPLHDVNKIAGAAPRRNHSTSSTSSGISSSSSVPSRASHPSEDRVSISSTSSAAAANYSAMAMAEHEGPVPVFVAPPEVQFVINADAPDTRKVLTLYNPYDYDIRWKVLCTAPEHYGIDMAEGLLTTKRMVSIPIRGKSSLQVGMMHRLKIEARRTRGEALLGSCIVALRSVSEPQPLINPADPSSPFQNVPASSRAQQEQQRRDEGRVRIANEPAPIENVAVAPQVLLFFASICLIALCLPTSRTTTDSTPQPSVVPELFHVTDTQRISAAFILGVCSVLLLLQPNRRL